MHEIPNNHKKKIKLHECSCLVKQKHFTFIIIKVFKHHCVETHYSISFSDFNKILILKASLCIDVYHKTAERIVYKLDVGKYIYLIEKYLLFCAQEWLITVR